MNNNIKAYIERNYSEDKFNNNIKVAEAENNVRDVAENKLWLRCLNHVQHCLSGCSENDIISVDANINERFEEFCEAHTVEEIEKADHLDVFKV